MISPDIYIRDLENPANTYTELKSDNIEVNVYENIAVVTLLVKADGMRESGAFSGTFRNIRIFLKEPDKQPEWQLHTWFNVKVEP
jgi:hypothetical protein